MPRQRHNETGADEDVPCTTCGHLRKHHKKDPTNNRACQAVTYDPMGPSSSAMPCACPWFTAPRHSKVALDPNKPVDLTLTWQGEHPVVGDYLMSIQRARYAYRILDIHVTRRGELEITATKMLVKDVPKGAKIHALRWNERKPKHERERRGWGE